MMVNERLNTQQKAAIKLMQNDLRFIYTMIVNKDRFKSNYIVSSMPYIGIIIDGVEDWLKAYNNSCNVPIACPSFTKEEENYYEEMRGAIKIWDDSYLSIKQKLEYLYQESDNYFSNVCKPIAKELKLYDIFGADLVDNQYCGNTILCSYYIPQYKYSIDSGEKIKKLSEIGGKYIVFFEAATAYNVNQEMDFIYKDYGGFVKSPIGNQFSDKFVLFSLLCQIQFILYCIEKFILDECSTKLRFAYLQYYYVAKILPELNNILNTSFYVDCTYVSDLFRNSMAHYKVGVALKPSEINSEDLLFGLTQKFFNCNYLTLKKTILENLTFLAQQFKQYLGI